MTTRKRRIEKLETGLTPKQAFILWLQDAHSFNGVKEYVQSLKGQPDDAAPIPRLTDQVEHAVKQRLKGQPREEIDKAVRQAYKDVLFLFFLHQQVNGKLFTEERHYWSQARFLIAELKSLMREQALDRQIRWNKVRVELEMPYPLDAETAGAVEAAKQHHVLTWEMLEEGDDVGGWLAESFLAEGKTALPDGAYGTTIGARSRDSEIEDLFQNAGEFQKFLDGEDYSYGLADVTDSEYDAHYEAIVCAIKRVVQPGFVVDLPTVPHQFLREAPLFDGDWIDRYIVELAEWGARLVQRGYRLEEPEDQHPLAWQRIVDPEDGSDVDHAATTSLWQQTRKHLARFQGRTKVIDDRQFLSFADYVKRRGRHAKGDLKSGIDTGLVVANWNQWVEENGCEGVAALAGVKARKLNCYLDSYRHWVCWDAGELAEEIARRKSLLDSLQVGKSSSGDDRFRRRVERWRRLALGFLSEVYTLRKAIESINQRYFDGQQPLFPSVAEGFDQLLDLVKKTVGIYNRALAGDIERLERLMDQTGDGQEESMLTIDLAGSFESVQGAAREQVAYMVDMAKAEALELLGETRQAYDLVDRHV